MEQSRPMMRLIALVVALISSFVTGQGILKAPKNLRVEGDSTDSIKLRWNRVDDAVFYNLVAKEMSGKEIANVRISVAYPGTEIEGLKEGTSYRFAVQTKLPTYYSGFSKEKIFTTRSLGTPSEVRSINVIWPKNNLTTRIVSWKQPKDLANHKSKSLSYSLRVCKVKEEMVESKVTKKTLTFTFDADFDEVYKKDPEAFKKAIRKYYEDKEAAMGRDVKISGIKVTDGSIVVTFEVEILEAQAEDMMKDLKEDLQDGGMEFEFNGQLLAVDKFQSGQEDAIEVEKTKTEKPSKGEKVEEKNKKEPVLPVKPVNVTDPNTADNFDNDEDDNEDGSGSGSGGDEMEVETEAAKIDSIDIGADNATADLLASLAVKDAKEINLGSSLDDLQESKKTNSDNSDAGEIGKEDTAELLLDTAVINLKDLNIQKAPVIIASGRKRRDIKANKNESTAANNTKGTNIEQPPPTTPTVKLIKVEKKFDCQDYQVGSSLTHRVSLEAPKRQLYSIQVLVTATRNIAGKSAELKYLAMPTVPYIPPTTATTVAPVNTGPDFSGVLIFGIVTGALVVVVLLAFVVAYFMKCQIVQEDPMIKEVNDDDVPESKPLKQQYENFEA